MQDTSTIFNSESVYRELVEAIEDVVYIVDSGGRVLYVNRSIEPLLDYTVEEVVGRHFSDFVHPDDLPLVQGAIETHLGDKRGKDEYRLLTQSGEVRWVQFSIQPIWVGNQSFGMRGMLHDVTEQHHVEEQMRASLREKEVLLQEVHHRVKNNLQIISSLLDMQAQGIQESAARQVLQDSRNRIRVMAFVHDRLYQSRNLASVNLDDYIRSVVSYLHGVYGNLAQHVALHLKVEQIPMDLDTAIPCGLIISELVSNALKYAFPPDSREGEIWVALDAWPDEQLMLTVRDNGCGLSPDIDLDHPPSLGLQLVDILSQQIGGRIHVKREGGTTFQILFPRPRLAQERGK